ncbi:MAG: dihydrofolate reductase [Sphingobacteriales bacterium]|jgi:dihydrofolate reductase
MINLIVAHDQNRVIGKDNDLIWHLPGDLKFFKNTTLNHVLIMGRKTFESFPGLLPKRENVVITRQRDYKFDGAIVFHSLIEAVDHYKDREEVFIAGGANIYEQSFSLVERMYITKIDHSFEGDAFFPEYDEKQFQLKSEDFHPKDEKNKYDFTVCTYLKN